MTRRSVPPESRHRSAVSLCRPSSACALGLAALLPLAAQSLPPAAKDEAVRLSPFVIEATADTGYLASSTLAGSRLRTDFRDVASQVSVMTPDFLADIGAFSNNDAFSYSMNTENAAEVGGVTAQFFGTGATGNEATSRTRGLGAMSNTRNFFRTEIPNDIYNTGDSGLTMAGGPNAILFGLGSPAGLAESRYNVARLSRSRTAVALATDTNGTRRGSLDHNQPLIRDRLGLRLDLLNNDRRFALRPAYEKDHRIFGTLGYAPNRRVRVDVFTELMDRQASRPVYVLPRDNLSIWVNPAIGNRTPYGQADVSPTPVAQSLTTPNATGYLFNWGSGQDTPPTYTYGARMSQPGVYIYRYTPAVRPVGDYLINGIKVAQDLGAANTATFNDERFYPFSRYNVYGGSHPSAARANRVMVQATVDLGSDLHLEVAANHEQRRERQANSYAATEALLTIDPSAYRYNPGYIPLDPIAAGTQQAANRAANAANRGANPLLGTYYLEGAQQGTIITGRNKEARASLAYLLDAPRRHRGSWLAWLGRHSLSANVSYGEIERSSQGFLRLIKDDGSVNPATGVRIAPSVITAANAMDGTSATGRYLVQNNRLFRTRAYIDPNDPTNRYDNQGGLDPFGTWTFTDPAGNPYQVGLFDVGGGTSAANGQRSADLSKYVAWQAFLLQDRVVLTYGRRWDAVRQKVYDPASGAINPRTGLAPYFDEVAWGRYRSLPSFGNTTKSVVVHPLRWVSLFYNLSTSNEAAPATVHDIDGSLYSVPTGQNRDYGINLQLGGVGLRINQFRTASTSTDAGNSYGNVGTRRSTYALEGRYIAVQRLRSNALGRPEFADYYLKSATTEGFNAVDNIVDYYRVYADSLARGTEIELAGRVRRLDVRVSAGRTRSVKTNIGPNWLNYAVDPVMVQRMEALEWYAFDNATRRNRPVVAVSPTGQIVFGNPGDKPVTGWRNIPLADSGASFSTTMFSYYQNTLLPQALQLSQFNGMSNPAVREWRFSSTLACDLGGGWRGGFSTRLREKAVVSYATRPITLTIGGQTVTALATDLQAPLYNDRLWYFDPFVSYTIRAAKDRRVTLRLNVRNALNERKLQAASITASSVNAIDLKDPRVSFYGWTNANAIPTVYQAQDPREVAFSATVDF